MNGRLGFWDRASINLLVIKANFNLVKGRIKLIAAKLRGHRNGR
jgi:hypothetical protein